MSSEKLSDLEIAQMMCSKLCHDLITPVGAINNGLELLADPSTGPMDEMLDLVGQSAQTASGRLTLFRFAFGAGASVHMHALIDLESFLNSCVDRKRYSLHWQVAPHALAGDPMAKVWGKIITNIIIMGMEACPYGGQFLIECKGPEGAVTKVHLMIRAKRVCWNEEYSVLLSAGTSAGQEINPRNVQPYYTWRLMQSIGVETLIESVNAEELQLTLVGKTAATQVNLAGFS